MGTKTKKTKVAKVTKRTLTSDELIQEIAEILAMGDGEFIADIANRVIVPGVKYVGDSMFEQEWEG